MSVKLQFDSPSEDSLVRRTQSFTGFSSLPGRRRMYSGRISLRSTSLAGGKSPRVHLSPSRVGGVISSGQPEQVDRIFQALRKGLKEYLEAHQAEMDFLTSQQRDTKRNSRLAFLYDLEKEIRAVERFIRRLEFQISKVEELYETYCIQWRLCQGAINMKKAFSLSPSSRASRDSLLELHRNHRHCMEDMSMIEGDLEILLGELHIKMKGLIGFARLCPGDQYEVVVRLGRQRWRVRGRIQSDDRQSWDEAEMVFLPHIHHNFQIKVMEAKGLGWLLVGMVTCASADFFVAQPQMMVVDITELGTIKLQLEVAWNPFDSVEKLRVASPSKHSVSSRKGSIYSWTSPSTASFTEKYFISMVRRLHEPEDSFPSLLSKNRTPRGGVSLLSYLADPAHTSLPPITTPHSPSLRRTPSYSSTLSPSMGTSLGGSHTQLSLGDDGSLEEQPEDSVIERAGEEEEEQEEWGGVSDASPTVGESDGGSLLALQRSSIPDLLRQNDSEQHPDLRHSPASGRDTLSDQDHLGSHPVTPAAPAPAPSRPVVSGAQRRALALRIGTLLAELENIFQDLSCSDKELRTLDNQILHLGTILKNDLSLMKSSSDETLAVEEVLGSFDFLSCDFNAEDDTSCLGSLRMKDSGISTFQQNTLKSLGLLSEESQSASEEELVIAPLTSGNWSLDQALETHLDLCSIVLKAVRMLDSPLSLKELLEEASLQADVLETISRLLLEKSNSISTSNIFPKAQRTKDVLSFWEDCISDNGSLFCCHTDAFSKSLRKRYTHKVKAKQPGQSEKVFSQLLQQVQSVCGILPSPRPICSPDRVTVFQLSSWLKRLTVHEIGEHVSRLSREVYLASALTSPKRRRTLKKLRGRRISELLPLGGTLRTLAMLQIDSNHRVCEAASSCLRRAAGCNTFRSKALLFYTESLKEDDVSTKQAACLALKCLKATESVDQIAELWRSTDEDLRGAARETVLSFGKKGYLAFQRMEQLSAELQEAAYQNQDTEITIF